MIFLIKIKKDKPKSKSQFKRFVIKRQKIYTYLIYEKDGYFYETPILCVCLLKFLISKVKVERRKEKEEREFELVSGSTHLLPDSPTLVPTSR